MRLDLERVIIQGFRSYREEQALDLPAAGFWFMGGVNVARPEKGPNGVGKSSFWDAIIWCLTGQTSRGQKAGKVANWKGKEPCKVSVVLKGATVITRTWSPNSLTISRLGFPEEPITQEELEQRLGCNYETLTSTLLMSQFGRYFFDLQPTEKLSLFSGLFDLEYWLGRAASAKAKAKEAAEEREKVAKDKARSLGALRVLREGLAEAREKARAWGETQSGHKDAAESRYREASEWAEEAREQHRKAKEALRQVQDRLSQANDALVKADAFLKDKAKPRVLEAKSALTAYTEKAEALALEIKAVERLQGSCPTCHQRITKECVQEAKAVLLERAAVLRREGKEADEQTAIAKAVLEEAQEKRDVAEKEYSQAEKVLEAKRQAASQASKEEQRKAAAQETAKALLQSVASQDNPHAESVQRTKESLRKEKARFQEAKDLEARWARREDRATYWVGAFKDLRLWLIEQALLDFEICVANSLGELGLPDWRVTFDVERTNQSGSITKGFTVNIQSPESGEPVPWESWSGGETQRLRIAGACGLADLVRARKGFVPSLEVWDEPTAHLSPEGEEDLLRFLRDRAQGQGRALWLIDHKAPAAGEFDGRVSVRLEKRGSRLQAPPRLAAQAAPRASGGPQAGQRGPQRPQKPLEPPRRPGKGA